MKMLYCTKQNKYFQTVGVYMVMLNYILGSNTVINHFNLFIILTQNRELIIQQEQLFILRHRLIPHSIQFLGNASTLPSITVFSYCDFQYAREIRVISTLGAEKLQECMRNCVQIKLKFVFPNIPNQYKNRLSIVVIEGTFKLIGTYVIDQSLC